MVSVVPADHIDVAFQCLLGRPPENSATIEAFQDLGDLSQVIASISASPEAQERSRGSVFWHYNTCIDVAEIIRSHENHGRRVVPDRLVNFLGVIIDPDVYPRFLPALSGTVEGLPIPANWHADMAEFAAALRAVDLASGTFRVLELGCGWGCWLLITGVAARTRGLKVDLIGAEGDSGHIALAERGFRENGFAPTEYRVVRGIVGPKEGWALFPKQEAAGESWGLEPIFDLSREEAEVSARTGKFEVLPTLTLAALSGDENPIDLLHIDIQGGEAAFIEGCLADINKLVHYIVVGTHSREIEGAIISLLSQSGWILEIERPAIFTCHQDGRRVVHVDGVQGWRNRNKSCG